MIAIKKLILGAAVLTTFLAMGTSFSDNPPPFATCMQYLSYPDAIFYNTVNNSSTAATIAVALEACQLQNACVQMPLIPACGSTLATRLFASEYFSQANNSNANNNNANNGNNGGGNAGATNPSANPANTTNNTSNNANNSRNNNSIHWF